MAGAKESDEKVSDMKKMYDLLLYTGRKASDVAYVVQEDDVHQEWVWTLEFSKVIE